MTRIINDDDLAVFRNFLSQPGMGFSFKQTITNDVFDIERYYNMRFEQRKLKPEIAWPKHLSKKEKVLCKLNMVEDILKHTLACTTKSNTSIFKSDTIGIAIHFLKEEKANCYVDGWNGISDTSANALNDLYTLLVKSYNEYLETKFNKNQSLTY